MRPGSLNSVQHAGIGSLSKPIGGRRAFTVPNHLLLVAGMMAPAAWLLTGCGSSGDLISTVALPSLQTAGYADGVELPGVLADRQSGKPELTPAQRDYLGALEAAGIRPSNELRALNVGSYVCQARAAGQSDQAVWDSVAPMVRSDVTTASATSPQRPVSAAAADADSTVDNYIRIAIQRLC